LRKLLQKLLLLLLLLKLRKLRKLPPAAQQQRPSRSRCSRHRFRSACQLSLAMPSVCRGSFSQQILRRDQRPPWDSNHLISRQVPGPTTVR
jgi:hypothetical protein